MKKWQLILFLLVLENLAISSEQARAAGKTIRDFICSYEGCGINFTTKYSLIKHRVAHTGKWPYVCGVCDRGFVNSINLTQHKRTHRHKLLIHMDEKPYVCDICSTRFTQMGSLNKHKRLFHDQKASVDKKRLRDTDIVEFEDPGLLDDFFVSAGTDGLASEDLGLDDVSLQSLFDDLSKDV